MLVFFFFAFTICSSSLLLVLDKKKPTNFLTPEVQIYGATEAGRLIPVLLLAARIISVATFRLVCLDETDLPAPLQASCGVALTR